MTEVSSVAGRWRERRQSAVPGLLLLPAIGLMFLFLAAVAVLLSYTLRESALTGGPLTLSSYERFLSSRYYYQLTWNTFVLGATVTAGTLAVGYPTAYALARIHNRAVSIIAAVAIFAPLLVSVVIRAFGWLVLFSSGGLINVLLLKLRVIHQPLILLYTHWSVDVSLIHILMPFMVFPVLTVMRQMDGALEEAARDLGAGPWRTFRRVTLPLSLPGVVAGTQVVFSICISAYVSPALLGGGHVQVLAPAIYQSTIDIDWPLAGVMTLVLLILSLGVLLAVNLVARRVFTHQQPGRAGVAPPSSRSPLLYLWLVAVGLLMALPIAIVVIDSFTSVAYSAFPPPGLSFRWYRNLLTAADWVPALENSVAIGIGASVIAVSAGTLAAYALTRFVRIGQNLVRAVFLAPFVVPRIGIGLAFFTIALETHIFGTLASLILAHAVITLPFAIAIMSSTFVAVPRAFEEAAMDLGANPFRTFVLIIVPQIAAALTVTLLFVFVTSFDEVETSLFLVRPGNETIPIAMLTYMLQYQDPTVAALASVLIAASLVIAIAAMILLRRSNSVDALTRPSNEAA